jgi:hypothetical protein
LLGSLFNSSVVRLGFYLITRDGPELLGHPDDGVHFGQASKNCKQKFFSWLARKATRLTESQMQPTEG